VTWPRCFSHEISEMRYNDVTWKNWDCRIARKRWSSSITSQARRQPRPLSYRSVVSSRHRRRGAGIERFNLAAERRAAGNAEPSYLSALIRRALVQKRLRRATHITGVEFLGGGEISICEQDSHHPARVTNWCPVLDSCQKTTSEAKSDAQPACRGKRQRAECEGSGGYEPPQQVIRRRRTNRG